MTDDERTPATKLEHVLMGTVAQAFYTGDAQLREEAVEYGELMIQLLTFNQKALTPKTRKFIEELPMAVLSYAEVEYLH